MKKPVISLLLLCLAAFGARGQVVISEIHYHPVEEPAFNADGTPFLDLSDDIHEFVEIQNTADYTIDLSGWSIAGGIDFTFPSGSAITPGAFRVIAKNPSRIASVYSLPSADIFGPYDGGLSNKSDSIRLRDAARNTIDSVTYDSRFPWAQSADKFGAQDRFLGITSGSYQYKGRSLQRVSVTWNSNDPANWLASPMSGPTPGTGQAVSRVVPKPVIIAFSAAQTSDGATIVRPSAPVTVNCTFGGTADLSDVTLEYFVDSINSTSETRTQVLMTDIGAGKYTATIPGQASRSVVRYRFKANRGEGMEVISPRADDPQIAPVGTGGAREAWHGYFVTPVRSSSNAAVYDVFVSTASLSTMSTNITQNPRRVTVASATGLPRDEPFVTSTDPQWNGTVPGVFACNGEVWDIHIRYHGSLYHRSPSIHSYKVHFPKYKPFNEQTSWFETLHGLEFIEAQKINRLLGIPASKMRKVDWYLNSAANEVHTEQGEYTDEMLDAWHELQQQLNPGSDKEETGELYKDVGNREAQQNNVEGPYTRGNEAPMLANAGWTQLQRYDWNFSLQNNEWKGPKPLHDLIEGMWTARGDTPATHNFSSNPTRLANARAWFNNNWDMDTLLTSMALLQWMSIWDDACQNHFFWRRASGKWVRLGWDYDQVMSTGGGGPGGGGTTQTLYGGEYGAPTVFDGVNWWKDTFFKCFRTEFNQRLWELTNSFFDADNLSAQGLTRATAFAPARAAYINSQLSSLGTYYKPVRPTNVSPSNGSSILTATNLTTSTYSHPQSMAHKATKWEIRKASGDYEEPVLRVASTTNLTTFAVPFDQLTYGQTYYWRATHIDANNHASVVSAETGFTWGTTNTTPGAVVLNEILALNRSAIENGGSYPDYIELHNNSTGTESLAGYMLTDDPTVPDKFVFPANVTITPGGYLMVWCDSDTSAPGLHAGFALDSDGETVVLMNGTSIVDSVSFGPQAPDVSIGRIVNGTGGWQANKPTPEIDNSAKTLGSVANLKVNEWMADPTYGSDWFEIYNADTEVVTLSGLYLSDTPSTPAMTQVPALSFIEAGGFQRFWADDGLGTNHCAFKLGKSGDKIILTSANGTTTIDSRTFSAQTTDASEGLLPDNSTSVVRFSSQTSSPGFCNWTPATVVINELLANPAWPMEDAVELHNPTANPVNVGGWWLTDDLSKRRKFQLPAGTTVPAGGYLVLYAAGFASGDTPVDFAAKGGVAMLSAVDGSGAFTGYGSLVRFGASAGNVSFGRTAATGLNNASGGAEFWPQMSLTFGTVNTGAVTGPVIFNEIMYHPPDYTGAEDDFQDEFIELVNAATEDVDLGGWKIKGGREYTFPIGTTLPAGGFLLVVSFDPSTTAALDAFKSYYGLTESPAVYGPLSGILPNSTCEVELGYPANIGGYTRYVNVDKVEYRDSEPWPTGADGGGVSLHRLSTFAIGNTADNWTGAAPSPGSANNTALYTAVDITNGLRWWSGLAVLPSGILPSYDVVSDGVFNLADVSRIARKAAGLETNP
jgi:hypothetical protein